MKVMVYVNMFSRGVGRVQEVLRENGNGEAIFELGKITIFNVVVKASPEAAAGNQVTGVGKSSLKILVMIKEEDSVTTDEMARLTGFARRSVTKQFTKLKQEGRIRRVGLDKGGHWEVLK